MNKEKNIENSIDLLLDVCSLMMSSGANTKRVIDSINRFAQVLNLKSHALISHKSIIMTLIDLDTKESYTVVTQIPRHGVNYTVVSDISRASWVAVNHKWSFEKLYNRIQEIKGKKRYPLWVELITVSLAGAGFAKIFGGDYLTMLVAFVATFVGFAVSKIAHYRNINTYVRTYIASLSASLIASLAILFEIGGNPEVALATSILFLVPGVQLINSFNDLYNNHILNGMVRFISGFMIVLAIGLGMITIMLVFNLNVLN